MDIIYVYQDGFGNLKAGCRQCGCDLMGSKSDVCDANTGQCQCHPGVSGLSCNFCKENYFGFSNQGCQGMLHQISTELVDINKFIAGYLCFTQNLLENFVTACECHPHGALQAQCDRQYGQCSCRPNVEGRKCDHCLITNFHIKISVGIQK